MVAGPLLWAATLAAQTTVGEFQFPTYPLGPQIVGLGGAGAALARDAESGLNPASLLQAPRLSLHHFRGYADYSGDLLAASLGLNGRVALGFTLRHFGWKDVIQDDLGSGTSGLTAGNSEYSLKVAGAPTAFLQVGTAVSRLVTDNIGVRTAATSFSAGAIVHYSGAGHVGVALRHAGGGATNADGSARYSLPTRLRFGLAQGIRVLRSPVLLAADAEVPPRAPHTWMITVGLEWLPSPAVAFRAGHESSVNQNTGLRESRWATGIGLTLGRFDVGLATRFGGPPGAGEFFVGVDALRPRARNRPHPRS